MKRALTLTLSLLIIVSLLSMSVAASAFNPAGGCKTETTIYKANAADVVKDGQIGANEYTEIEINRDAETTDLLLSFLSSVRYNDTCSFLNNVHFYLSWDETHGLNVGVKAELLETPANTTPQPDDSYYGDEGFPGDEFLFQFGMMFRVADKNGDTVLYRGISLNTDTNTMLYGHYGEHGYTGSLDQTPYQDYIVSVNGNVVTYEISFPIESVVESQYLSGKVPAENTELLFSVSATGGSEGQNNNGANTYCVSIGDGGYMTSWRQIESPAHAKGYFSHQSIAPEEVTTPEDATTPEEVTTPENATTPNGDPSDPVTDPDESTEITGTTDVPTQPSTTQIVTSIVTSEVVVTDDDGNEVTDEDGNKVTEVVSEVVTSIVTDAPTDNAGNGTSAPPTGSSVIIAAVVAAISACGVVVTKKRK